MRHWRQYLGAFSDRVPCLVMAADHFVVWGAGAEVIWGPHKLSKSLVKVFEAERTRAIKAWWSSKTCSGALKFLPSLCHELRAVHCRLCLVGLVLKNYFFIVTVFFLLGVMMTFSTSLAQLLDALLKIGVFGVCRFGGLLWSATWKTIILLLWELQWGHAFLAHLGQSGLDLGHCNAPPVWFCFLWIGALLQLWLLCVGVRLWQLCHLLLAFLK